MTTVTHEAACLPGGLPLGPEHYDLATRFLARCVLDVWNLVSGAMGRRGYAILAQNEEPRLRHAQVLPAPGTLTGP
jgi:hypothetical protein